MMYCMFIFVQPGNVACEAGELQALDDPEPCYSRSDDHLVTQLFFVLFCLEITLIWVTLHC